MEKGNRKKSQKRVIIRRYFWGLVIISLFIKPSSLNAQEHKIKFEHITIKDGLTNSKVNRHMPPVVITNFEIFNQDVGIGEKIEGNV